MPDDRRRRLKELETVIASGFDGVVHLGRALREIRDEGYYREVGASTFEQYVKSRWAIAARTAYYQIDAADIHDAVSAQIVQRPMLPIATEGVARELAPILHQQGPGKVAEAWAKVSEAYAGQRPPTAREVHRILVAEKYLPKVGQVSTGKPNARILLGQVGDRVASTEKRLDYFLHREAPNLKVADSTRKLATSYADRCQVLADHLRAFAEGREVE
jgi:hypothetical protein